jgi:DNA replication protein DnaC
MVDEIKKYKQLIVLDDFGAEKMTDFVRQVSYLIINYREQNKLQTIITSNFTLDEIDMYIDRRISSRIAGMCEVVRMSGDKRLKQGVRK